MNICKLILNQSAMMLHNTFMQIAQKVCSMGMLEKAPSDDMRAFVFFGENTNAMVVCENEYSTFHY